MTTLNTIIAAAHDILTAHHPRAGYAHAVIDGAQLWSGADLAGKAAKYGGEYARQRQHAIQALRKAGGEVISCEHGIRLTAVQIGQDDFGAAIYETTRGITIAAGKTCRHVA